MVLVARCRGLRPILLLRIHQALNRMVEHYFFAVHIVRKPPIFLGSFLFSGASTWHRHTTSVLNNFIVNVGDDFPQMFTFDSGGSFSLRLATEHKCGWNFAENIHFDPGIDLRQVAERRFIDFQILVLLRTLSRQLFFRANQRFCLFDSLFLFGWLGARGAQRRRCLSFMRCCGVWWRKRTPITEH